MKNTIIALILFASSWQTWNGYVLTVHETPDPNSPVCFAGKVEDYHGRCTNPAAPTSQYWEKVRSLNGFMF